MNVLCRSFNAREKAINIALSAGDAPFVNYIYTKKEEYMKKWWKIPFTSSYNLLQMLQMFPTTMLPATIRECTFYQLQLVWYDINLFHYDNA